MTDQPISSRLRKYRRTHGLSINRLSQLTGISRRTLSRIESGEWNESRITAHKSRTAAKLLRFIRQSLDDGGYLNTPPGVAGHVLFHRPRNPQERMLATELSLLIGAPWRQVMRLPIPDIGDRLRHFRMTYDLTLKEAASLLSLSVSHLHAIETGARAPSPRSRFRIMRLLTLPPSTERSSRVPLSGTSPSSRRGDTRRASSAGNPLLNHLAEQLSIAPSPPRRGSEEVLGTRRTAMAGRGFSRAKKSATTHKGRSDRTGRAGTNKADVIEYLRYLWLTTGIPTERLAAALEISQPHLIRILNGTRKPSRSLSARILKLV